MGVFHVFFIVQTAPNFTKCLICITVSSFFSKGKGKKSRKGGKKVVPVILKPQTYLEHF